MYLRYRTKNSSSQRSSACHGVISSSLPSSSGQGTAAGHFRHFMKHRGREGASSRSGVSCVQISKCMFQRLEHFLADVHPLPRYRYPGHGMLHASHHCGK